MRTKALWGGNRCHYAFFERLRYWGYTIVVEMKHIVFHTSNESHYSSVILLPRYNKHYFDSITIVWAVKE